MIESHDQERPDEKGRGYSFLLGAGIVVLLAYTVTYLLTVSPLVVRAIGSALGNN
jgi:hypothetical protein